MSILLDDRGHQPPLMPYFAPFDLHVESTEMDYSDLMFAGNGPNGTVSIGIERKRISDLINSMRSGRFSGFQLEGLLEFDYPILLVEGLWKPNPQTGLLEVMKHGFETFRVGQSNVMYSEVDNFINTFRFICGLQIIRTAGPEETARVVVDLAHWFQKDWKQHKAHLDIYAPVPERNGNGHKAGLVRRKASLAVKIAAQLPNVDQKAWQVGKYFGESVERMMAASAVEWGEALGIKDKKSKTVKMIMESLGG